MKRRSFLKTAAALFPAAGLESFSLGQTSAPSPSDQPHVIPAGEDRLGESHSRGYSSILFKVLPRETSNGMFVIEHLNLIKGGPPLHLHLHQEEYFYVIEGEVHFQIGDSRKRLMPGDSILGPRGVPHTFAATGEAPGRLLIAFTQPATWNSSFATPPFQTRRIKTRLSFVDTAWSFSVPRPSPPSASKRLEKIRLLQPSLPFVSPCVVPPPVPPLGGTPSPQCADTSAPPTCDKCFRS